MRCAVVAPTFPPPTTVIFFLLISLTSVSWRFDGRFPHREAPGDRQPVEGASPLLRGVPDARARQGGAGRHGCTAPPWPWPSPRHHLQQRSPAPSRPPRRRGLGRAGA